MIFFLSELKTIYARSRKLLIKLLFVLSFRGWSAGKTGGGVKWWAIWQSCLSLPKLIVLVSCTSWEEVHLMLLPASQPAPSSRSCAMYVSVDFITNTHTHTISICTDQLTWYITPSTSLLYNIVMVCTVSPKYHSLSVFILSVGLTWGFKADREVVWAGGWWSEELGVVR